MNLDAQLLTQLRETAESGISGADLAQKLGVTRATVLAHIRLLRTHGYEIESSPHTGYQLQRSPDLLHSDDLFSRLGKVRVIGRDIRVFRETTSTNDVLEKLASAGVQEGSVVFAEAQTAGRGRLGRKWLSPPYRGLWFSVLLRPDLRPLETTRLTILAATALARAIRLETNLTPQIKWPNDLLLDGRKVAGILTELRAEIDRVKHVIIGIGVDVNLTSNEFPAELRKTATSIRIESGAKADRAALAAAILRELDADYHRLRLGRFEAIADEWEKLCTTLGHAVTIRLGPRTIQGVAESLDNDGALLIRTQHGRLERVTGGDVTVESHR